MSLFAALEKIAPSTCDALVADVVAARSPAGIAGTRWLLAHCDGGVVWGRREDDGLPFDLSSAAFADQAEIGRAGLQQLRLFGAEAEWLIWQSGVELAGRRLADAAGEPEVAELAAYNEVALLLGDHLRGRSAGFTLIADDGGSRQAVPLDLGDELFDKRPPGVGPAQLRVRHHLELVASGAVRVAASRLCDVFAETNQRPE